MPHQPYPKIELHVHVEQAVGIEVRLTPDIPRDMDLELAAETERHAARYRDRGVVGIGIAGSEVGNPPGRFRDVYRGIVCDVCLYSNLRLGLVDSLADHPLPAMLASYPWPEA